MRVVIIFINELLFAYIYFNECALQEMIKNEQLKYPFDDYRWQLVKTMEPQTGQEKKLTSVTKNQ